MQDVQNIPNPDVNSVENDDFGNHSSEVGPDSRTDKDSQDFDIERPAEDIPVPPDDHNQNVPIEEPPSETEKAPVDEDNPEPKKLV